MQRRCWFQFQTGAIKRGTLRQALSSSGNTGFNSKLVRLKTTPLVEQGSLLLVSFNSKLVRLKVLIRYEQSTDKHSFNSKLVRLKACSSVPGPVPPRLFQFQTGAIKSRARLASGGCAGPSFQFQTGAIKSYIGYETYRCDAWFQFQTGAIKRSMCAVS